MALARKTSRQEEPVEGTPEGTFPVLKRTAQGKTGDGGLELWAWRMRQLMALSRAVEGLWLFQAGLGVQCTHCTDTSQRLCAVERSCLSSTSEGVRPLQLKTMNLIHALPP